MNDNNNHSNEVEKAIIWAGIGISVVILLVSVNGPIFINNLLSALPTPNFQGGPVFNPEPNPQETIQVEAEPAIEEEVFFEPEFIGGLIAEDLSAYDIDAEWQKGSTELYLTTTFSQQQNVYWGWTWCASDQETLLSNFEQINISVFLNDVNMDTVLYEADYDDFDVYCRGFELSGLDWIPGDSILRIEFIFNADIDDGLSAAVYPAGSHIREYQITVTE